ncbi:hypothetical protein [Paenibacillus silvae]|nr:hypothetical protein [Paenibacillus silvae]MCK6076275.1 hypothetical protein [Paenibacillus silvae]MCK6150566.1 hypothetical protein [Paenibacillus silvae]MCK6268826.1 hypothetical protein [Paenibacillus silvae]MCK6270419.1 hypothetical protein [Paenibacillus silvae]
MPRNIQRKAGIVGARPAKCTEQLALLSVKYPHSDPLVGANGTDDET